MATAVIGNLSAFNAGNDWSPYKERLQFYFQANSITDKGKKQATFLLVMGPTAYKLLKSLVTSAKLDDLSFMQLVEVLTKHYSPLPFKIVERYKFYSRFSKPGQSVSTFLSELCLMLEFCNFGATLDNMLRDQMVCGINDDHIQKRLLSEPSLTLQRVMELAESLETAAKHAWELRSSSFRRRLSFLVKFMQWALPDVLQIRPKSHAINVGRRGTQLLNAASKMQNVTTPKFCKARPVPYALRGKVETELERLTKEGIIEPVQFADWAVPIVPVLKSNKESLSLCGDYKLMVNQASKLDQYPIPPVEDLFSALSGGNTFSKLDMSQVHQQIELDEESKQFVVVNTHKGLFRYNQLPFGVSSAPVIFQRVMESLLQGMTRVVMYPDNILVTGKTEEEHLTRLEEVLSRLEQAGLQLKRS